MPFNPKSTGGGTFVKLADLVGQEFDIVAVRGPMDGRFGEELKVDLVVEGDEEEKTVSVQTGANSRTDWLKEAQQYLDENPSDTIPARIVEVETKAGNTFRQFVTAYAEEA